MEKTGNFLIDMHKELHAEMEDCPVKNDGRCNTKPENCPEWCSRTKNTTKPMANVGYKDLPKSKLIKIAASLLVDRMSDFAEDYPRRFPKKVLKEIEKHNERLRLISIEISKLARTL